ncbi:MAG TPA: DUF748 domain-containing protein [Nitrospira sp.]|nr:DUF748 domain-containing protein [Nitrospira sp.]
MGKRGIAIGIGAGIVLLLLAATALFIDGPLRSYIEQKMNRSLKGYTVHIGSLDFHPIGFSVELEEVILLRTDEPEPPVATIARWTASLHWRALLSGRVVNDQSIERPKFHITRTLAKKEAGDDVPVKERGWQDAVESVYPFKINQVRITDAELTYIDEAQPERPLRARRVNLFASNIRNVHSSEQDYPSEFSLEGTLFESGSIRLQGHADFLAEPHVAVKADLSLDDVPLGSLIPVTGRYNVQLSGGTMSAEGTVEYAPSIKVVNLKRLTIDNLHADYVHASRTEQAEAERAQATVSTARSIHANEETLVRVDEVRIEGGELGFVNQAVAPEYRLYLADSHVTLNHYSNQLREGPASVVLTGKFMGTGDTHISSIMRPPEDSPDQELKIKIAGTQIRSMNNLLRAYGNFDVVAGVFSCYAELRIDDGSIRGYVKPLVRKLDVYDTAQDQDKKALEKVREGAIEDLSTLLENVPRQEVATKANVSGDVTRPHTETIQIVIGLIQNAFFKAILPGFEREFGSRSPASKKN